MPMTSPVLRISGDSSTSTPENLTNGNTGTLTETCSGTRSRVPSSTRVLPVPTSAAILANGVPVAFDTNGTVREPRGLTSKMYRRSPLRAYCTFIKPTTTSSRASATVVSRISLSTEAETETGGMQQVEAPEGLPAPSTCSMIPAMTTSLPSATASTSNSIALAKNSSINTG